MSAEVKQRSVKVVIIGAGITGLCQARTYFELAPDTELVILDDKSSVGGVWAEECCYEGLKTQNTFGSYEYSDFPMNEKYGCDPKKHIPGLTMHKYITDYAKHHDLVRHIKFRTRVTDVTKLKNGDWEITARETDIHGGHKIVLYRCQKIVCSVGLSSTANPISIPGMEKFGKKILATIQLRKEAPALIKDAEARTVTVLGGSKTAYDMVYTLASAGKKVNWCIRQSGIGPLWMIPKYIKMGLFKVKPELLSTFRFMSWFSPCIWGESDGYGFIRRLLNKTPLGRYCMNKVWQSLRMGIVDANGYRKDPLMAALEPDESIFWTGRVGILNYATDIHDFVRSGQVNVRRVDVSRLSENGTLNFTDGTTHHTDALIAITGWTITSPIKYHPEGLITKLGIPTSAHTTEERVFWDDLDKKADAEILDRLPYLKLEAPARKLPIKSTVTPFRLYRALAPPGLTASGDNSIVFLKMFGSTSNMVQSELQVLWTYAYFENQLSIQPHDVYWQTALMSRFGKHRAPCGFGAWHPELVYDSIPYSDLLLKDLGLSGKRKDSLWDEIFGSYSIHDYKGVVQEWKKLRDAR